MEDGAVAPQSEEGKCPMSQCRFLSEFAGGKGLASYCEIKHYFVCKLKPKGYISTVIIGYCNTAGECQVSENPGVTLISDFIVAYLRTLNGMFLVAYSILEAIIFAKMVTLSIFSQ